MAPMNKLERLLLQRDEEIRLLKSSNAAYVAKISSLQAKLLSALDSLDALQTSHAEENVTLKRELQSLKQKIHQLQDATDAAEVEKEDMRDAVLQLIRKVEATNGLTNWPYSNIHVSSLAEAATDPIDPLAPQTNTAAPDEHDDLISYAASMIRKLCRERDAERSEHERTRAVAEARIVTLEARISRREAELEKAVGSFRLGNDDKDMESKQQEEYGESVMESEQVIALLDGAVARNKALEGEIKSLLRRLDEARSVSSKSKTQAKPRSTVNDKPSHGGRSNEPRGFNAAASTSTSSTAMISPSPLCLMHSTGGSSESDEDADADHEADTTIVPALAREIDALGRQIEAFGKEREEVMRSLGLEIKSPNVEGTSDKAGEAAVGIGAEVVKGKEGDTINDEGVVDLAFESKLNSIPTHLDHGHRQSPIAERTTAGNQARSGDHGGRHEPRNSRDVGVQTDLLEDDLHQTQLRSRERELEEMKAECARLRDTERVLRARIEEYELKEAQVEDMTAAVPDLIDVDLLHLDDEDDAGNDDQARGGDANENENENEGEEEEEEDGGGERSMELATPVLSMRTLEAPEPAGSSCEDTNERAAEPPPPAKRRVFRRPTSPLTPPPPPKQSRQDHQRQAPVQPEYDDVFSASFERRPPLPPPPVFFPMPSSSSSSNPNASNNANASSSESDRAAAEYDDLLSNHGADAMLAGLLEDPAAGEKHLAEVMLVEMDLTGSGDGLGTGKGREREREGPREQGEAEDREEMVDRAVEMMGVWRV